MDDAAKNKLWEEYSINRTDELREKLIVEYAPLVKIVAGRLSMYLGYNVEYDDLCGYGIFGLIDAIDKFDYGKNVKFETYASLRIRGAILDQIRKMDWIPRSLRQKQKRMEAAMSKIESVQGRIATDEELADELGITVDEFSTWQEQAQIANVISLDEFTESGSDIGMDHNGGTRFEQPDDAVEKQELKKKVAEAIDTLTEKERSVILLYYYEEMTLKEISRVLDVSESRVSQLHTRSIQKLKDRLGNYINIFIQ